MNDSPSYIGHKMENSFYTSSFINQKKQSGDAEVTGQRLCFEKEPESQGPAIVLTRFCSNL